MKLGFEASVTIDGTPIKTIGDITCDVSRTEIEVKNRASNEVRFLPGMINRTFELDVQSGTDGDDQSGANGSQLVQSLFASGDSASVSFTSADGFSWTKDMICTKITPTEPVDGLSTVKASFKTAAKSEGGGGAGGSGSGSGSGSGT